MARERRDDARALIVQGIDPSDVRKASKVQAQTDEADAAREAAGLPQPNSFEHIAREWYQTRRDDWSPTYGQKIMRRLEVDVFPWLGAKPVNAITPPMVLAVLRRVEGRGVVETAHRALENCGQVFRYAVATGQIDSNPARDLKDALRRPMVKHFAAITSPERLGTLLRAIHSYRGTPVVNAALKLLPMLLLRPGELRQGEWSEIDLAAGMWSVPAARMKREKVGKLYGKPHLVPLARQAVAILEELQPVSGRGVMVFRGERTHARPMSDAAINAALRAMGFSAEEVTGHGFRATARTMLVERLGVSESAVEAQLAHSVKDSLGRAYNRTEFMAERLAMMQRWADYLDELRAAVPA